MKDEVLTPVLAPVTPATDDSSSESNPALVVSAIEENPAVPGETIMADPKMTENGGIPAQVPAQVALVTAPAGGKAPAPMNDALMSRLLANPEAADVLNVIMSGGLPTPEKAAQLFRTLGVTPEQMTKALEPVPTPETEAAAAAAAKPKGKIIPLAEALNRTMPRLRRVVRAYFPEDMALMLVIGHGAIQVSPVLMTADGTAVNDEIGGKYPVRIAGDAIEEVITEIGILTGAIEVRDSEDEDGDPDDGDEDDDEDDE